MVMGVDKTNTRASFFAALVFVVYFEKIGLVGRGK